MLFKGFRGTNCTRVLPTVTGIEDYNKLIIDFLGALISAFSLILHIDQEPVDLHNSQWVSE